MRLEQSINFNRLFFVPKIDGGTIMPHKERRALLGLTIALLSAVSVYATVFAYRGIYGNLRIDPPAVWFEDPIYPGVMVELFNNKTRANVEVRARNADMRLLYRTGVVYDMRNETEVKMYFEEYGRGCSFSYTTDGAGIKVVGNPQGGLYGGCVLRYRYPIDAVNLTATFVMKTDDTGTLYGIRGAILANSTTGYYYMAGLKNNRTGWFFGIYKYTGTTVREPGGPSLPPLIDTRLTGWVPGVWFSITISYIVYPNGTVVIRGWLYNVTGGGSLVAYIERVDPAPIPGLNTFGVGVYQIVNQPSAVFQMVGFTQQVNLLIVRGLGYCCQVYVYDSGGGLIGYRHVNETGIAEIELANSAVANATVKFVCGVHEFTVPLATLLGGDVYEVYFWFEGPILQVFTRVLNQSFIGWARIVSANCTRRIYYVRIGLVNQTYVSMKNATVEQLDGAVFITNPETETLIFTPSANGWSGNITSRLELYYGSECTLTLLFYYSYAPGTVSVLQSQLRAITG